ncbi:hypothetical protein [Micromonospora sp. CPCC 205558]|uniref:hypothetical protein n=1 Tax=Micromonospora sp. CPCC 205558 TaxID=3122403 RepID=UPI002FEFAB62
MHEPLSPERVSALRPIARAIVRDIRVKHGLWDRIVSDARERGIGLTDGDKVVYRAISIGGTRVGYLRHHVWVIDPRARKAEAACILGSLAISLLASYLTAEVTGRGIIPLSDPKFAIFSVIIVVVAVVEWLYIWRLFRTRRGGQISYLYLIRRYRRRLPELLLADRLQRIAGYLESPYVFSRPSTRRHLGRGFEECARLLELHVPRRYAVGEVHADRVLKNRCMSAAQQLREFGTRAAVANAHTRIELTKEVSILMTVLIHGTFDRLPVSGVDSPSGMIRTFTTRAINFLRYGFVAVAPFVFVVWVLPQFADVPKVAESWLRLVTAIWMIISILVPLDPFFSSKIAALKEVSSSLRAGSGGSTDKK